MLTHFHVVVQTDEEIPEDIESDIEILMSNAAMREFNYYQKRAEIKDTWATPHRDSVLDDNRVGKATRKSVTSKKAALEIFPRTGTQRHRIFMEIVSLGGHTREELCDELGMNPKSVDPRVKELIEGGWIEVTRTTRKTRAGNDAEVLDLTQKGRDRYERS